MKALSIVAPLQTNPFFNKVQRDFFVIHLYNPGDKARELEIARFTSILESDIITKQTTIEMVAREMNLSPHTLKEHCKKIWKKTPHELIDGTLVQKAKKKLQQTEIPIKVIALTLKFHDASHFTHFFKKYTGVTPTQYRNFKL